MCVVQGTVSFWEKMYLVIQLTSSDLSPNLSFSLSQSLISVSDSLISFLHVDFILRQLLPMWLWPDGLQLLQANIPPT